MAEKLADWQEKVNVGAPLGQAPLTEAEWAKNQPDKQRGPSGCTKPIRVELIRLTLQLISVVKLAARRGMRSQDFLVISLVNLPATTSARRQARNGRAI